MNSNTLENLRWEIELEMKKMYSLKDGYLFHIDRKISPPELIEINISKEFMRDYIDKLDFDFNRKNIKVEEKKFWLLLTERVFVNYKEPLFYLSIYYPKKFFKENEKYIEYIKYLIGEDLHQQYRERLEHVVWLYFKEQTILHKSR